MTEAVFYKLWGFCDASVTAYAAIVDLVVETSMGESLKFVMSKTRVALKQT